MAYAHASRSISDTFDPYSYATLSYDGSKVRLVVTEDDVTRATADWTSGKVTISNLLKVTNMHKFPMDWVTV